MKKGGRAWRGRRKDGERNSVNFTVAVRATTETLRSSRAYTPVDFDQVAATHTLSLSLSFTPSLLVVHVNPPTPSFLTHILRAEKFDELITGEYQHTSRRRQGSVGSVAQFCTFYSALFSFRVSVLNRQSGRVLVRGLLCR